MNFVYVVYDDNEGLIGVYNDLNRAIKATKKGERIREKDLMEALADYGRVAVSSTCMIYYESVVGGRE